MSSNESAKHAFLHVPVDELQVVRGPGRKQFEPAVRTFSASEGVQITLHLKTSASRILFKRKVQVWDVRYGSGDDGADLEDFFQGRKVEMIEVEFSCRVDSYWFQGTYNVLTRVGRLY